MTSVDGTILKVVYVGAEFAYYRNKKLQQMVQDATNLSEAIYEALQHMRHTEEDIGPFVVETRENIMLTNIGQAYDMCQERHKRMDFDHVPFLREQCSGAWICADVHEDLIFT